jgi:hypothetical protein
MLATKFEETRVYREIREERSQEIAINLLRQGFTVEAIAQATDLMLAQVQDLQRTISYGLIDQSSICNSGTCSKSRRFLVTTVDPANSAIEAIRKSWVPIRMP